MSDAFEIQVATPRHVSPLMALIARCHREFSERLAWPPIDELSLMHAVGNVLARGRAFLALQDGKLVGSVGLRLDAFFWSGTPYVGDVWFYVVPPARSFPLFRALVAAAEEWANEVGGGEQRIPLMLGTMNVKEAERLEDLYEKVGFTRVGGLFVKGM